MGETGLATQKIVQCDFVSEAAVSLVFLVAVFEVFGITFGYPEPGFAHSATPESCLLQ